LRQTSAGVYGHEAMYSLTLADILKHFNESIIHKVHIFTYFLKEVKTKTIQNQAFPIAFSHGFVTMPVMRP
jgi:hypothetical protein